MPQENKRLYYRVEAKYTLAFGWKNSIRQFETYHEAKHYARQLFSDWPLTTQWRVLDQDNTILYTVNC